MIGRGTPAPRSSTGFEQCSATAEAWPYGVVAALRVMCAKVVPAIADEVVAQ
jgi:hypothetical protein